MPHRLFGYRAPRGPAIDHPCYAAIMAIQVLQIVGDTVELIFDPLEDLLQVGQNLSVVGHHEDRGLIVQIIELTAIFSESLPASRDQIILKRHRSISPVPTNPASRSPRRRKSSLPARDLASLHVATAKIRRVTDPIWQPWDGWIPNRGLTVTRTAEHEMLRQCLPGMEHPLRLGKTLASEPFSIDQAALGAVNLIIGTKGPEASHLARVILGELIEHGVRCVIFDTTGTYAQLSAEREGTSVSSKEPLNIVHFVVGESLKLGLRHDGLDLLLTMLSQFGLPKAVGLYFESQVTRRLASSKAQHDSNPPPPFLGIDYLIHLARELEAEGHPVVGGAILSCLEAIKKTQIFASQPAEATGFEDSYAQTRDGGALVIDLSVVPRRARAGITSSMASSLREIAAADLVTGPTKGPFIFFDEAQLLVSRHLLADGLMAATPPDLRSFFITTMVSRLEGTLLDQADNLFLTQRPSEADITHLRNSSLVDADTLRGLGRRLHEHHSLLVGKATGGYPIVFAVHSPGIIAMNPASSAVSHTPRGVRVDSSRHVIAPGWGADRRSAEAYPSLPLFPDEPPRRPATAQTGHDEPLSEMPQPPMPTIAQVTAMWEHVVKRVARRRRILETILSAARPLRIAEQVLVVGFPPQHRFQQELIESEEYRSFLQDELSRLFGVNLEVTTEVYPV
jgi:hypothetical protein